MFLKNNKGFSIIILLVVFMLIGLAYFYSFRGDKVAVEKILGDTGLIDDTKSKDPYSQAIEAAKKVKLLQMRPISEDDYYIGNLDAPVQIIYYSDFECPFCPSYVETLNKVLKNYGDDVVLAFRHFILSNHNLAFEASLASECAGDQGNFWDMYNKLYEDSSNEMLNKEEYLKDAQEIGLDVTEFSDCLSSQKFKSKISQTVNEANSYGVVGTPSTYINGRSFPGAYPYEDFTDQLGKERKGLKTIVEEELNKNK